MTIQDLKNDFQKGLSSQYTKEEINTIFYALAEKYLQKSRNIIRLSLNESWGDLNSKKILFDTALMSLQAGMPYQYITGECNFMGHTIFVNQNVLIPRPETEELVEWVLEDAHKNQTNLGSIIDIGTGSGAIAIALKKQLPNTKIYALDISSKAIETADNNAKFNNVEIHFITSDFLKKEYNNLPNVDLIISNPPYIPQKERPEMPREVVAYEPNSALFVPDDNPLIFYERIIEYAEQKLNKNGEVYVEFHQDLMQEVKALFLERFKEVKAKKDISGNWRMLKCTQMI